jgi:PAS domain S-box-containing protein
MCERSWPAGDAAHEALALVNGVKDYALFLIDRDGRVRTWNRGAQAIKQYAASEIIGEPCARFYTPEDVAAGKPARLLRQAAANERAEDEGWRVRKDGSRFWAAVVITALSDERGQPIGFAKVTRDLTKRKAAEDALRTSEQALRQSEERLRLMIASVVDYAIFMLDPQGNVATWNRGAERLKGYSAGEIIGSHISRFYPREDAEAGKPASLLVRAASDGRTEDEGWRVRKDGSRFWANVVISAMHDDTGQLVGFTKVTRDMSEHRRAEQAEQEAAAERVRAALAEQAVRERDVFLSVAAHELRTPLTALLLKLEGLGRIVQKTLPATPAAAKIESRFADASRQTLRLSELVERLLDVSRMAAGQLELERQPIELEHVARTALQDLSAKTREPSSEIMLSVSGDTRGEWDRGRIEQVVLNLLSNAVKYGEGKPIEIAIEGRGPEVALAVVDRGIGISAEDLARIFEPFERAVPIQHFAGFGLGLYVARRIVAAHGGTIDVSTEPGRGARFEVTLPRRAPEERPGANTALEQRS